MERCFATFALIALASAALCADVTVTMTGGGGGKVTALTVTRIKGMRARMDLELEGIHLSTITDLTTRQVIRLQPAKKTAQVSDVGGPGLTWPAADISLQPTGRTQDIDGRRCDELKYAMTLGFEEAGFGSPVFKGVKMNARGSVWVTTSSPGAAEYLAFQKAAMKANLAFGPDGAQDQMMQIMSHSEGIPCLTEMEASFEGGPPGIAALMPPQKLTRKVTQISTAPMADDVFTVPSDYTVTKR